jgi:hypothetical protein
VVKDSGAGGAMTDAADQDEMIARLRRDFYLRKGDVWWRKRAVDRFEARFPGRAMKIWNARFADQPVGTMDKGRRGAKIDGRFWPIADLIGAVESGIRPNEIARNGNPYHDDIYIGEGPLAAALNAARDASGLGGEDLLVLAKRNDPFGLDTPAAHRDARLVPRPSRPPGRRTADSLARLPLRARLGRRRGQAERRAVP